MVRDRAVVKYGKSEQEVQDVYALLVALPHKVNIVVGAVAIEDK